MSVPTRTPRATVEEFLRVTAEGPREALADFYAPDAVIRIPFAPEGFPPETTGRETMRARMKATAGLWSFHAVDEVTLHETGDPEVVIAEFRVRGRITATAEPFTLTYINVIRVVDGLIVSSRDYGNPQESLTLRAALPAPIA
ncbi:nuclear transport factor 2 family protein [Kitasatospora sp. NPDC094028]